jgi:hypothetical protein
MADFTTTMLELQNKQEFDMDWVDDHFSMGEAAKPKCKFS